LSLKNKILSHLKYTPTPDQENLVYALERFTFSNKKKPVLIVNGYAGTGKTSSVAAYVKTMVSIDIQTVLLAPTGRAAKVFSSFAGKKASTIHKHIYMRLVQLDGSVQWTRTVNKKKNTVFIVDEASMIACHKSISDKGFGFRSLLDDLLEFIFEKKGNRLILVGDLAQLPPVGESESLALSPEYISGLGFFTLARVSLKNVVRQEMNSGILTNATDIRYLIDTQQAGFPKINIDSFKDIQAISGIELEEKLETAYDKVGIEKMVFVTWSNKRANLFNGQIRQRILWMDEPLNAGDRIMVVKNNYFWLENDFIANGEILVINKVLRQTKRFGFKFADLSVSLIENDTVTELEVKVLMDVLMEDGPALSAEKQNLLFTRIEEDYSHIKSRTKRFKEIYNDPWFNALQIKFGYAVTAHKSQGGQWPVVFLEAPYLREPIPTIEDLRWLYTGFTRASEKIYLVNFSNQFFNS